MHDAHVHEMQCKCGSQTPGVLQQPPSPRVIRKESPEGYFVSPEGARETIGPTLELLGPGGLEKCFLTHIPSAGKEF